MTGMSSLLAERTEGPAASESTGLTMTADRLPLTKFWSWLACWEASFWASVTVRSTPSFFASSSAPFLICTKNGLFSVDSDSPIFWLLPPEEPLCSSEVAPTTATATTAAITYVSACLPRLPPPDAPAAGVTAPALRRSVSKSTASAMTTPMTTCCQNAETDSRLRPLRSTARISAPISVPEALPVPPASEARR